MNRRSLLLGLGGALAAPAIVRAETLMKLWVPKQELLTEESLLRVMLSLPPSSFMTPSQVYIIRNVSKDVLTVTGLNRVPFSLAPGEQWSAT